MVIQLSHAGAGSLTNGDQSRRLQRQQCFSNGGSTGSKRFRQFTLRRQPTAVGNLACIYPISKLLRDFLINAAWIFGCITHEKIPIDRDRASPSMVSATL